SKITLEVVADTLKVPVSHAIANDFVSVIDAINRGLLLRDAAPRAKLTQDIQGLVNLVSGTRRADGPRRSFLGGLFGGKQAADGSPGPPQGAAGPAGRRAPAPAARRALGQREHAAGDASVVGHLRRRLPEPQARAAPEAHREAGPAHDREAAARS